MKKLIIWLVIAAIILVAGYFIFNNLDSSADTNTESDLDSIPNSEFANLDSNDQVLDEIDSYTESLD